jgi:hypothetical protein
MPTGSAKPLAEATRNGFRIERAPEKPTRLLSEPSDAIPPHDFASH